MERPDNFREMVIEGGGRISDGPLPHGFEGWGMMFDQWHCAHYWILNPHPRDEGGSYKMLCADRYYPRVLSFTKSRQSSLHAPGNFPKCKRCERVVAKGHWS